MVVLKCHGGVEVSWCCLRESWWCKRVSLLCSDGGCNQEDDS